MISVYNKTLQWHDAHYTRDYTVLNEGEMEMFGHALLCFLDETLMRRLYRSHVFALSTEPEESAGD